MNLLFSPAAAIFAALTVPIILVAAEIRGGDRGDPNIDRLLQSDKARDFKKKFLLKESVDLKLQTMTKKNKKGKMMSFLRHSCHDGGEEEEFDIDSYKDLNIFSGPCKHNGQPKACPASTISTGVSRDGKTVLVARSPKNQKVKTLMVIGRDGKIDLHLELFDEIRDRFAVLCKGSYDEEAMASQFKYGTIAASKDTVEVHPEDLGRRMQEAEGTTVVLSRDKDEEGWQLRHARQIIQVGKEQDRAPFPFMKMETPSSTSSSTLHSGRKLSTSACTTWSKIQVAIVYDSTFCASFGDEAGADAKVQEVVALASERYQQDGLCVKLEISDLEGWCDASSDPYKPLRDTNQSGCGGTGGLNDFKDYFNANRQDVIRDVAHLFVGGGEFSDPAIGCAFTGGSIGVWCDLQWAYGINRISFSSDPDLQAVVFAHELGHNGGAGHESTNGYIMYGAVNIAANGFSSNSIASMRNSIDATTCIEELPNVPDYCDFDADCDNGNHCDGDETCVSNECVAGAPTHFDPCDTYIKTPNNQGLGSQNWNLTGYFFDVSAGASFDVVIKSIELHMVFGGQLQIFTKPGSGSNFTTSASDWNPEYSEAVAGGSLVKAIFNEPLTVPAGSTLAIYVHSDGKQCIL